MEQIKFQLNHCYSITSYWTNQTYVFILQKRTKKKCTFLEISQNELHKKSRLHTCTIDVEFDFDTNQDYESCFLYINKEYITISSIRDETPIPQSQFNDRSSYIAYAHTGRRKIYFLHVLEREGNRVYVELYGSSFKTFLHTKVLKPVNGYYEILNLIVQGEQLTFKSNFYNFLLYKPSPQKMEALKKSADAIDQSKAKVS